MLLTNPFSYPLHVASWANYGRNRRGSVDYRITNPFNGKDLVNGGKHQATDAGNTRQGDTLRALGPCRGIGLRHFDGTLIDRLDFGSGVVIDLAHLSKILPTGRWTQLATGQAIGTTGATGPRISDGKGGTMPMPAHTHIRAERHGVPFDIEPFLPMVERPAKPLPMEDDMAVPARLSALAYATLGANNNIRATASLSAPATVTDEAIPVQVFGTVPGDAWTIGNQKGSDWYWIAHGLEDGFVATALLPNVTLTSLGRATLPAAVDNRIPRARTAVAGARQALEAAESVLA